MSRPPDADSAETFERILDAARVEVSLARPRNAISLRRVAQRAEVSLGTVQYYFAKKEELLEACLDGYHSRLLALGASLLAEVTNGNAPAMGRPLVEHAIRTFYRFVREERAMVELRRVTSVLLGELHPQRQPDFLGTIIERSAEALAPHTEISQLDVRLSIQLLSLILMRFALMSDSEREFLTGGPADDAVFEDYVVRAACRLLVLE